MASNAPPIEAPTIAAIVALIAIWIRVETVPDILKRSPTRRLPDAAPKGAINVEQPTIILTRRPLEVNPKASAAWMLRLSGQAPLGGVSFRPMRSTPQLRDLAQCAT